MNKVQLVRYWSPLIYFIIFASLMSRLIRFEIYLIETLWDIELANSVKAEIIFLVGGSITVPLLGLAVVLMWQVYIMDLYDHVRWILR